MPGDRSPGLAYAEWIDRNRRTILFVSMVLAVVAAALAARLPLKADLSNLLPPSARSVRDLEALKKRGRAFGTAFVVVKSDDPALRSRAARALYQRLQKLDHELVTNVDFDDSAAREYVWKHRFLFADLKDLTDARDAIKESIRKAKLEANPLFVDLDDEDDTAPAASDDKALDDRVDALKKRLEDADHKAHESSAFVSKDGTMQLLVVRTTFPSSDTDLDKRLVSELHAAMTEVRMELPPGVTFGATGNVVTIVNEQQSVMHGLWRAAIITVALCALALFLYFRSLLPVAASLWSLAVGTLVTFGIAKLTIGHLNLVTAFLAAIVVGNGINSGLILLARYFEEVRAGRPGNDGMGAALVGAARGTLAASLTAGVAYGSLIITDFDGFRHFGIIGALGMVLCWVAAFTVLPAALCSLRKRGHIRMHTTPAVGRILSRMLPRRLSLVVVAGGVLVAASCVLTARYVAGNPLQEDWRDLRPSGSETHDAVVWLERVQSSFDDRFRQNISGPLALALDHREDAPRVAEILRHVEDGKPPARRLLGDVTTLDSLLPGNQAAKLPVLNEIRDMIDSDVADELEEKDKDVLQRIRPPDHLRALTDNDVPEGLGWMFIEQDGTRGRLVLVSNGPLFESWNVHHWQAVARAVRGLDLPNGTILGGKAFVFTDMLHAMRHDGPKATIVAIVGAFLCVWLIVGLRRHGVVTMLCGFAGVVGMIALVALWGLEVNVIDFIALPITVGIGIDYAVNIAARDREEGGVESPRQLLATTGGAVLLCSYTTIVGYGSLLLSDSGGIRSFGLAAILGEIACVIAALALAPALLGLMAGRRGANSAD